MKLIESRYQKNYKTTAGYKDQVHLLIQVIPEVEKEKEFALHVGTSSTAF